MIQTSVSDGRGGRRELTVHDAEYWEGPYRYEPYPKAMYRQTQPGDECECRVVNHQQERDKLGSDWFESPADAKAHFEKLESDIARAAAERQAEDQKMSAEAILEALKYDRSTDQMLGEIPQRPKRKYVKKVKPPTA